MPGLLFFPFCVFSHTFSFTTEFFMRFSFSLYGHVLGLNIDEWVGCILLCYIQLTVIDAMNRKQLIGYMSV